LTAFRWALTILYFAVETIYENGVLPRIQGVKGNPHPTFGVI